MLHSINRVEKALGEQMAKQLTKTGRSERQQGQRRTFRRIDEGPRPQSTVLTPRDSMSHKKFQEISRGSIEEIITYIYRSTAGTAPFSHRLDLKKASADSS